MGEWRVHGGGATFRPDGTGRLFSHDGFTDDGGWVDEVQTVTTKLSVDGNTLIVTIVEDHFEVNGVTSPNPNPQYGPQFIPGASFALVFEHQHLLKIVDENPDSAPSNPYLCGDGLAPEYEDLCGL